MQTPVPHEQLASAPADLQPASPGLIPAHLRKALQARLDRWELQHLRNLASDQATLIEGLQAEMAHEVRSRARAEEAADFWREELLDIEGVQLGLTTAGHVVALRAPRIGETWVGGMHAGICPGRANPFPTLEAPDYHLLLSAELPEHLISQAEAEAWARRLSEEWSLPTPAEAALIMANLRPELTFGFWTCGRDVPRNCGIFQQLDGAQACLDSGVKGMARAVRRIAVQPS